MNPIHGDDESATTADAADPAKALPSGFEDLEVFAADWVLDTTIDRYRRRIATPMDDLRRFYRAMQPRLEAALAYLDQFPLDAMPAEANRLHKLILGFSGAALAVETYGVASLPMAMNAHEKFTVALENVD